MKDYNLIIAEIAASIVTDCLGESLTANTYYSADGNFIIMAFSGYPLRGSDRTGNVYVQFPRNTFYKKRGNVHFTPIYQSRCRYYQESIGNQLAHPHVYIDGHPSWDNTRNGRMQIYGAGHSFSIFLQLQGMDRPKSKDNRKDQRDSSPGYPMYLTY